MITPALISFSLFLWVPMFAEVNIINEKKIEKKDKKEKPEENTILKKTKLPKKENVLEYERTFFF